MLVKHEQRTAALILWQQCRHIAQAKLGYIDDVEVARPGAIEVAIRAATANIFLPCEHRD